MQGDDDDAKYEDEKKNILSGGTGASMVALGEPRKRKTYDTKEEAKAVPCTSQQLCQHAATSSDDTTTS